MTLQKRGSSSSWAVSSTGNTHGEVGQAGIAKLIDSSTMDPPGKMDKEICFPLEPALKFSDRLAVDLAIILTCQ
jgi:hypothetical protein